MNISFPSLTPAILVDPRWFNPDSPCDEEAEIAALENRYKLWLNSVGQQFKTKPYIGKNYSESRRVVPEAITDEEEVNEESEESEETHDEDEEEEEPSSYSPTGNNNEADSSDELNEAPDLNGADQSALWPTQ